MKDLLNMLFPLSSYNLQQQQIPGVIPQVGFGEVDVYATLPLPCEGTKWLFIGGN